MEKKFAFTKERLSAIPPAEKGRREIFYDEKCPSLQIRVTSRGVKTFSYYRRPKGRPPTRISLGRFPEVTIEQARDKASLLVAEILKGGDRAALKRTNRGAPTFATAFEEYLDKKRNRLRKALSDSTKRDYSDLMKLHLSSIGRLKMSLITKEQVRELHDKISKRSPAQADKCLALISAVYNYALDENLHSGPNPATGILKNPATERERIVTSDELPALFDALEHSALRDFFLVALLTGARRSNVASMQWKDINLVDAVWRIPTTKNGHPLSVHLIQKVVEILEVRKANCGAGIDYVFPGTGKSGHLMEPKTSWATLIRRASFYRLLNAMLKEKALTAPEYYSAQKLSHASLSAAEKQYHPIAESRKIDPENYRIVDLRIHDLRRTFGSWQGMSGASLPLIGRTLGHKTVAATAIYTRIELDPVRRSVETATAAMLVAGKRKKHDHPSGASNRPPDRDQVVEENEAAFQALTALIQDAKESGALFGRVGDKLLIDHNKLQKKVADAFLTHGGNYSFRVVSGEGELCFSTVQVAGISVVHGSIGDASQLYREIDPSIEIPYLPEAEDLLRTIDECLIVDLFDQ